MSIYNRDNIPYQNMIDSMIRNRAEKGKLMGDNWRKQGEIWGGFVKDTGALAGRTMDALQAQEESPENVLKKLEEELAEAKAAEKWETKPTGFNDYAEAKLQEKLRRDSAAAQATAQADNRTGYDRSLVPNYAIPSEYRPVYNIPQGYEPNYSIPQSNVTLFDLANEYRRRM